MFSRHLWTGDGRKHIWYYIEKILRIVGNLYFDVFCGQASNITMASTSDSQRTIAQKTWELSNNVLEIAPGEEIYKYDKQQQQQMLAAKPWEKDHHFFKDIKVLY